MPPLIEFRRVSVMRGDILALQEITLSIAVGEHVAVLGPNGSGKSSFIRTITRECYPLRNEGSSLTIMGRDRWNVFDLRRQLGIVTPALLARAPRGATGLEAVLSGFFSSDGLWAGHQPLSATMEAQAGAVLARLQASHLAGRPIEELSSGELRRIQVARALVHEPLALLLDEPSTHLDLFAQAELRRMLRSLAAAGTGIVLVTHHLADIIPEIDRIVLLDRGRIVGDGPKETMLQPERLSALFGVRVDLVERSGFFHAW
ncbi:MAG TPA: ATP-binding cassette domain-containing protein [Gemmatimonadales bacterium]|nr:ATP-binding cassette domain-containing protein [Gemmatimonadales bacterium]